MDATTSELVWLKTLLATFGIFHHTIMRMFWDSEAAIHIAKNPVFHERTKHIEMDCHFVREKLESGVLALSYLSIRQQPANIFTKALGKKPFLYLRSKLGMIDLNTSS